MQRFSNEYRLYKYYQYKRSCMIDLLFITIISLLFIGGGSILLFLFEIDKAFIFSYFLLSSFASLALTYNYIKEKL